MRKAVVELSHRIADAMPTYPGLPSPTVDLYRDHAASRAEYQGEAEFAIGRLELVGNTATYLDSPYHRFPDGQDVSQIPLARLVDLPTVVVDARSDAARDRRLNLVLPAATLAGRAVLFRTDWSLRWGTDAYWEPGPYLGEATVQQLVHHRPAVVGVDFWNVDDIADPRRPAHTQLLAEGITVVEHLRDLARVGSGARTSFVPLAVAGAPSLPIRAYAIGEQPDGPRDEALAAGSAEHPRRSGSSRSGRATRL